MRKREEETSNTAGILAVIISSVLIIGGIWVLTSGLDRNKQQDRPQSAVGTLNMFRALQDQPRAALSLDATTRAEAVAEREAGSTACLTHVVRTEFQCSKVSTDGKTTVARCFKDAASAMAAVHHETAGQATANAAGVGVAQKRSGCVYVAVEMR